MSRYQPKPDDAVYFGTSSVNTTDYVSTGVGVFIQGIGGWDDGVEVREQRQPRSAQHGERALNLFYGGKTLLIEGFVQGSSWSDLQQRKRALAGVFVPTQAERVLKMPDPTQVYASAAAYAEQITGYERMSARVLAPIEFGEYLGGFAQQFSVSLRASDPRRYSDVLNASVTSDLTTAGGMTFPMVFPLSFNPSGLGGYVSVTNAGIVDTPAVLRVTGPVTNPAIYAQTLNVLIAFDGLSIADGDYVDIDLLERTVTFSDGSSRYRYLDDSLSSWFLVPPGVSEYRIGGSVVADPAKLTISYRNANL